MLGGTVTKILVLIPSTTIILRTPYSTLRSSKIRNKIIMEKLLVHLLAANAGYDKSNLHNNISYSVSSFLARQVQWSACLAHCLESETSHRLAIPSPNSDA